jgi:amino acid transporter
LWFYSASASAPVTVLIAGVGTTFAVTGVTGVPVSYLVLMVGLSLLTVGYVTANGYLGHTAPFLAVTAHGLGRAFGLACGLLAVFAYLALQVALFGFLGATLAAFFGSASGWPFWSVVSAIVLGVVGLLRVDIMAKVLAVLLVAELVVIVGIVLAGFLDPAGGTVSLAASSPVRLFIGDWGGVLALSIAGFIGWETSAALTEEARSPRAVRRAVFGALFTLGPVYWLASLAVTAAVGPAAVQKAFQNDPVLPLTILAATLGPFGPLVLGIGQVLLVTSVGGAVLAFASAVNRYVYAMARERLLPAGLARTSGQGRVLRDAPVTASLVQTGLLVAVVLLFAGFGADPITVVFTWPAVFAAFAVITLLLVTSMAAMRYLARHRDTETAWIRLWAPFLGVAAGGGLLGAMTLRMHTLLGAAQASPATTLLIPSLVGGLLLTGLVWAGLLYAGRRDIFRGIGAGRPHPLAYPERRLAEVEL